MLVTEQQHLERVLAARAGLPALEHVIVVDPPPDGAPAGVLALGDVEGADPAFDAEAAAAAVGPDDLVTLIYTSGTTGPPKGVELTHRNLSGVVRSTEDLITFPRRRSSSARPANMSPANIEATLKAASPLIGQAVAVGDGRPYNVALIVLDADFAPAWAAQQGIEDTALEALAGDERMRAAVQAGVDAANAKLSRPEQVKRFAIVPGDWAPGGDKLTPTMKLKRRPIAEEYAAAIDALYAG